MSVLPKISSVYDSHLKQLKCLRLWVCEPYSRYSACNMHMWPAPTWMYRDTWVSYVCNLKGKKCFSNIFKSNGLELRKSLVSHIGDFPKFGHSFFKKDQFVQQIFGK